MRIIIWLLLKECIYTETTAHRADGTEETVCRKEGQWKWFGSGSFGQLTSYSSPVGASGDVPKKKKAQKKHDVTFTTNPFLNRTLFACLRYLYIVEHDLFFFFFFKSKWCTRTSQLSLARRSNGFSYIFPIPKHTHPLHPSVSLFSSSWSESAKGLQTTTQPVSCDTLLCVPPPPGEEQPGAGVFGRLGGDKGNWMKVKSVLIVCRVYRHVEWLQEAAEPPYHPPPVWYASQGEWSLLRFSRHRWYIFFLRYLLAANRSKMILSSVDTNFEDWCFCVDICVVASLSLVA